jgi:hypothetical protein
VAAGEEDRTWPGDYPDGVRRPRRPSPGPATAVM